MTDALNHAQEYSYNARGQNTQVKDAQNHLSTAVYDVLGNITRLSGPLGGSTEYAYDDLGRLISQTTSAGGTVTYGYNALNLRAEITNARGQKRSYSYDAMGRPTGYVSPEDSVSYTYDACGNVLTVTGSGGTITRTYDALHRVSSYTDTFGKTIRYTYDAAGNLDRLTYPDNTAVAYDYDETNRLRKVTDWAGRVTSYTYDANGKVTGITRPDGSTTATVYDDCQRVVSTVDKTASGVVISGFAYEYDDLGRIISENHLAEAVKICYTYDSLSRVTKRTTIQLSDNSQTEETYTYDAAGNIVGDGSDCGFVYDTNNRLTSYDGNAVEYDMDGNMTSVVLEDEITDMEYDSANRLTSAGANHYTYDAEDVRIRNLCGSEDTTYIYNTNVKLSQLLTKTTNGVVTKYVYGLGLIGEESGGTFKTYHFDNRGSTVAITDASGKVTDAFQYDTYGKMIAHIGDSDVIFGYNGRDGVVTDGNGLIYMRARYYSPVLRRFVNADVIAGKISNAITLNRYAYANGNPVSLIDPFGLAGFWATVGKIAAGIAVITTLAVATVVTGGTAAVIAGGALAGAVVGGAAGAITGYMDDGLEGAVNGFLVGTISGAVSGALGASGASANVVAAGNAIINAGELYLEDIIDDGVINEVTAGDVVYAATTGYVFNMGSNGMLHDGEDLAYAQNRFDKKMNKEARRANQKYAKKAMQKAETEYRDACMKELGKYTGDMIKDEIVGTASDKIYERYSRK